ncbi:peptidoglycan-binding domain-containing protein [Streptomyces sp. NPDC002533]
MKKIRLPRVKAAVLTAGLAATLLGGAAVNAPTASAATPTCNTIKKTSNGNMHSFLPATTGGSTSCLLATGNSGSPVSTLQTTLNKCYGKGAGGWDIGISITVDGDFGTLTKNALKKVQQKLKDTKNYSGAVDGIYGPQTRTAMHHRQYRDSDGSFYNCFRVAG